MNCVFTTLFVLSVSLVCLCTGLICPAVDFDATADVKRLGKAFGDKNWPGLTNLLIHRSGEQHVEIAKEYYIQYATELVQDCMHYLSGDYGDLIIAMVTPLSDYYAKELYEDAVANNESKSLAFPDILITSSNAFMKAINESYIRLYPNNVTSFDYDFYERYNELPKTVIQGQFMGFRTETQEVDEGVLANDAALFHEYSQLLDSDKPKSSIVEAINEILKRRSYKHLHQLITKYEIENVFEPNGPIGNMIKVLKSVPHYFADRLKYALDGESWPSTRMLNRIIVGRSEIDLDAIKEVYHEKYGSDLTKDLEEKRVPEWHAFKPVLFSDYRHALIDIIDTKEGPCSS